MIKTIYAVLMPGVLFVSINLQGQPFTLPIYNGTVPNSKPTQITESVEYGNSKLIKNVSVPEITVFLPTKQFATGQCVIICPGGGYVQLSMDLEGTDIAGYLNSIGVAALILKYRLPSNEYCIEPHKAPLLDAQRAVRLVRANAENWDFDQNKIGIMGFSAGGHLASTLGTHFDYGNPLAEDTIERQSCRPDFMVLMYSVVSITDSPGRSTSKKNLLGENPGTDLIYEYSNVFHVTEDTPPAFLCHANNDDRVPAEQSLLMYKALTDKNIPCEMHIFSEGGHGFGLATNNDHVASWANSMRLWLKSLNDL